MSAVPHELPADQGRTDSHAACVGGQPLPRSAATNGHPIPSGEAWRLTGVLLSIHASELDEIEALRISTENRARDLRQFKGGEDSPEEARLLGVLDALRAMEHGAELELKRTLRKHPLGPWVKATIGVGEKQGARLLAALGNPAWNDAADRPRRGPAELWAYCGLHVLHPADHGPLDAHGSNVGGVAARRLRGQQVNWNATVKMRAFLVAESCIKNRRSPYRAVYDDGRAKYADAVHGHQCPRCGPAGRPAQPGSPLSLGHQHARAIRLVMKTILRDIWREAKASQ